MMGAEPSPGTLVPAGEPAGRCDRRAVRLRALIIRQDQSTADITLLDLSYEGCGVETPVPLEAGEAIKLSVLHRGAIDARVQWCREGRAGLIFNAAAPREKEHWPRRNKRISLSAEVSLRRVGQSSYRVRVSDLSPDGCKVELVERPRIGEHMLIKFTALEVLDSEVCWVEDYVAGLRFEKAIHPVVFDLLLQRLG